MRAASRRWRGAVLAAAASAALATASTGPAASAAPLALGDRQDGAKVRIASGAGLVVRLVSNPATGFTWRLMGPAPGVRLVSERFDPASPPRRPGVLAGRPGVQSFRLRVTAPAGRRVPLRFAYRRWWSKVGFGRVWGVTLTTAPAPR